MLLCVAVRLSCSTPPCCAYRCPTSSVEGPDEALVTLLSGNGCTNIEVRKVESMERIGLPQIDDYESTLGGESILGENGITRLKGLV
jgi:hypothetical protein